MTIFCNVLDIAAFVQEISNEVVIADPIRVEKLLNNFQKDGPDRLQVVSDFHHTLSGYVTKDGQRIRSTFGIAQKSTKLSVTTHNKIQEIYETFIEPFYYNTEINLKERADNLARAHDNWFTAMKNDPAFTRSFVSTFCDQIVLRDHIEEFFKFLYKFNIPLTIASSGIGEVVQDLLKENNLLDNNVNIISNFFKWDDTTGQCLKVPHQCINPILDDNRIKETLSQNNNRKNIVLLGDNASDVCMTQDLALDSYHVLKIGFLNLPEEEWLQTYKKSFDIVIVHDFTMQLPLKILQQMFVKQRLNL